MYKKQILNREYLSVLSPEEGSRQAVIRELIFTEADYIKHLMAIVEVSYSYISFKTLQALSPCIMVGNYRCDAVKGIIGAIRYSK